MASMWASPCDLDTYLRTVAGIESSQPPDGGPIKVAAAMCQESQKSVVQQASQRHGHAETLGRGQRQADVLVSQWRCEGRGFELAVGDQGTEDLVRGRVEHGGGEDLDVGAPV